MRSILLKKTIKQRSMTCKSLPEVGDGDEDGDGDGDGGGGGRGRGGGIEKEVWRREEK